ncbi:f-box/kelch-repeat protein [Quercus suber]|uniref:F-box/kelch-repeat protein n=1 Tax=Quercus suber TaxID=58331 RepID=A0AAW0LQU1_QUESU
MRICKARRQRSFTIPNDHVEEILSRLPVKSLMRFKCVSKAWHTLISSHQFAKSHFQRASQNPNSMNVLVLTDNCVLSSGYGALFQSRAVHVQPVDVDFHDFPGWGEKCVETSLASCNGLVCIELYHEYKWTSQYLVWNPSTKSYKNIPSSTSTSYSVSCWVRRFGFGYDYSTDDYKILRPYHYYHIHTFQIEIFSLKTFTWRTIQVDEENNFIRSVPFTEKTIYCHGAIYWSAQRYRKPSIIYFDLADEIFHELPWPESVSYYFRDESSDTWDLGTFGEHLCLSVCTAESCSDICIQLWVMKESWTRLATIPYRGSCLRPETQVKGVGENSERNFKLTVFNLKKKAYRKTPYDRKTIIEATTYVESLYSLDCNDGLNQEEFFSLVNVAEIPPEGLKELGTKVIEEEDWTSLLP